LARESRVHDALPEGLKNTPQATPEVYLASKNSKCHEFTD